MRLVHLCDIYLEVHADRQCGHCDIKSYQNSMADQPSISLDMYMPVGLTWEWFVIVRGVEWDWI